MVRSGMRILSFMYMRLAWYDSRESTHHIYFFLLVDGRPVNYWMG